MYYSFNILKLTMKLTNYQIKAIINHLNDDSFKPLLENHDIEDIVFQVLQLKPDVLNNLDDSLKETIESVIKSSAKYRN